MKFESYKSIINKGRVYLKIDDIPKDFDINKFEEYIRAYDSKTSVYAVDINNKITTLIYADNWGKIIISDELAEAIKEKIMKEAEKPKEKRFWECWNCGEDIYSHNNLYRHRLTHRNDCNVNKGYPFNIATPKPDTERIIEA